MFVVLSPSVKAVAVIPFRREVRLIEEPPPRLAKPDEVRIRPLEVGVCGTDREICAFDYGTPPPGCEHLILGHEALCEVVETGADVERLRRGDLVVPSVRRPCLEPACRPCRSGRQDFCRTGRFREHGIAGLHGFLTSETVVEERFLYPLPHALREVGVLVEPLSIAEKSLIQVEAIQKRLVWEGRRALVLGAGPVGILGAMVLVEAGFAVTVYSRSRPPNLKSNLVESIGARYVSSEEASPAALAESAGPFDLVYEAVGVSRLSFEVLEQALGVNGIFVFTGIPPLGAPAALDTDRLMRNLVLKNQAAIGTVNAGPDAFERAIRDLAAFDARWPKPLRALITGRHPLEAYEDLLLASPRGIKNVFCPSP